MTPDHPRSCVQAASIACARTGTGIPAGRAPHRGRRGRAPHAEPGDLPMSVRSGWLDGKRALVVGAGSGIGRAVCAAFVAEGAHVAAMEIDAWKCETLADELPESWSSRRRDVSSATTAWRSTPPSTASAGSTCSSTRSACSTSTAGIRELDRRAARRRLRESRSCTNVRSQLSSVKAALPGTRADSGGNIVLTASTSSFFPGRGGVLYVSSKFAVRGLVVALANELAPRIRVNAVAPGGTVGHRPARPRRTRSAGATPRRPRGSRRGADRRTPLEVALEPDDHAGSYVFLASDRARGITGTFVHPDGGIGVKS